MRITILVEDTPGFPGAASESFFTMAGALEARGHAVTIVSRGERPSPDPSARFGGTCVFGANFAETDIPPSDVLVATAWSCVALAAQSDRGHVVHLTHGYEGDHDDSSRARIDAIYRRQDTHLVAVGADGRLAESMAERFERRVDSIPVAVDDSVFRATAARPEPPTKPVRVGLPQVCADTLADFRLALQACRLARVAGFELELVCGTDAAFSTREFEDDQTDDSLQIEWHHDPSASDRADLLGTLDVFLDASAGTRASAVLEAMACGVPCVMVDPAPNPPLSELQHALFAAPSDPAQLAEALVIAASHRTLRQELRDNGIQTAARYSVAAQADALESAFRAAPTRDPGGRTPVSSQPTRNSTPRLVPPPKPPSTSLPPANHPLQALAQSQTNPTNLANAMAAIRKTFETCCDLDSFDGVASNLSRALRSEIAHQRGLLLYALGDALAARESLRTALSGSADPAEVHNDLGVALHACGQTKEAQRMFAHALELQPDHPEARVNLDDCIAASRIAAN